MIWNFVWILFGILIGELETELTEWFIKFSTHIKSLLSKWLQKKKEIAKKIEQIKELFLSIYLMKELYSITCMMNSYNVLTRILHIVCLRRYLYLYLIWDELFSRIYHNLEFWPGTNTLWKHNSCAWQQWDDIGYTRSQPYKKVP